MGDVMVRCWMGARTPPPVLNVDRVAEFAGCDDFARMDGLVLAQRQAAFRLQIVAEPPLAVDPDAFRLGVIGERASELPVAIPVLVVDGGECEAERESARDRDLEQAHAGALGGENRDGQSNGEQIAGGAGEEDRERASEEDEHPLGEKVTPTLGATDENADADGDGCPEEWVVIVEGGADGDGDREERGNRKGRKDQPREMASERDGALQFLREGLQSVGGQVIGQDTGGECACGEALEELPCNEDCQRRERGDTCGAKLSAVKKKDRHQKDGLVSGERGKCHGAAGGQKKGLGLAIDRVDIESRGEQPQRDERDVGFERSSIDHESGCGAKEQRRKNGVGAEAAGECERAEGSDQREQDIGGVERYFRNVLVGRDQQGEEPGVERGMGLAAHIDVASHEHVFGVFGMQRFDLGVLGFGEIEDVVALQSLVKKGQTQGEDDQRDQDKLATQEFKIAGVGAPCEAPSCCDCCWLLTGTSERAEEV